MKPRRPKLRTGDHLRAFNVMVRAAHGGEVVMFGLRDDTPEGAAAQAVAELQWLDPFAPPSAVVAVVEVPLATLHRKRLHRNYVVDVTCPHCGHVTTVAFAGWIALTCPACAKEFARGPYLTPRECMLQEKR